MADKGIRGRICGGLFALGVLIAPNASSQTTNTSAKPVDLTELPIEQLMNLDVPKVYAASKIEQKTTEAPSSVTIITSEEVKKYDYRTLAELLSSVQGFYVSYDRDYDFLGVEGVNLGDFNDRILLLVDGHRVNNNYNDGAAIGADFILDPDLVDRVEIIRGPGSALYGDNAFFGVINVITRQGRQINGAEATIQYGSFDTYQGRVTYGKLFTNGVELLLSGTYYDSLGDTRLFYKQFDTPAQNNGVAQDMDTDTADSFFGSVGYHDLKLEAAYDHRVKVNPTAQYDATFDDSRLRTTDDRGYTDLTFNHTFPEIVDVSAQLYIDTYTHEIGYPQSVLEGTNVVFRQFSSEKDLGDWWGADAQLNKTLWDRITLSLGGEYRDDFLQDARVSVQDTLDEGSHIRTNRVNYGVYLQGDFEVLTNLHLEAGGRYDQYGQFQPAYDPRAALIYNPWEASAFKAIYGTAFRAPSFYELATSDLPLQPEKISSYDLVYEQGLGHHLRTSISGFYNQMDRLLVFTSGSFTNLNADTLGTELALEDTGPYGIQGRASYSYQYTHDTGVGWQMPDSPGSLVKLNLSAPLLKDKIFAGLEFQYTSARLSLHNTTDPSGQPLTIQGQTAGGYAIVNLTLFSRNLVKNLEFSATVYNLFDRRYSDPASDFHVEDLIQQDGRSFRLKLTYRF